MKLVRQLAVVWVGIVVFFFLVTALIVSECLRNFELSQARKESASLNQQLVRHRAIIKQLRDEVTAAATAQALADRAKAEAEAAKSRLESQKRQLEANNRLLKQENAQLKKPKSWYDRARQWLPFLPR